ncbi:MAG: dihydropteroate synthase [Labilithrix sp.]|nr:dihydropteroate synthase [Labilithrix sp.]MCW5817200.1 dihydropteroate synthase [Labilithrix sp.]
MAARSEKFADVIRGAVARRGAALMGICNVTPDSFSDGGRYLAASDAAARIDELIAEGADIIDVGGESTRPGSKPVPAEEQLERVLPAIRHAAARGACVSIDTASPKVAAAALDCGAHAINDVSLLTDEGLADVAGGSGAALILSHYRPAVGMRASLQEYGDVVKDVLVDWERAAERAIARGVPRSALVMDPGLGFSKTARHSLELLRRARVLVEKLDGVPVLVGASRKSFLTLIDRDAAAADRDGASIAAAIHAVHAGVRVLRVHAVRATRQAIDLDNVLGTPRRKI